MDWGRLREKEDLGLVMFPTSCLISDAQGKENSERGDGNQSPVGQNSTWRWGKNLLHVGISGPSLWLIPCLQLPCQPVLPTNLSYRQDHAHRAGNLCHWEDLWKVFCFCPPEITSFSSFICLKCQESVMLMRCTKTFGELNSFIVPHW